MAIIYSYPVTSTVNNKDTLVISVPDTTVDSGFLTKSLSAEDLALYVTARVNLTLSGNTGIGTVNLDTQTLTISGTSNEIETSASSQTLQIGLPDNVTITNNLTIGGDFTGGRGSFSNDLNVGTDLSVNGFTETSTLQVNSAAFIGGVLTMEDSINMTENGRIINLQDPQQAQDAATKQYVDGLVSGKVAKTGDTMSGKLNVNYQNAEIEIRNNNPSGSRSKLNFGTLMSTDQASVQLNNSSGDLEFRRGTQSSTPKITVQSTSVYFSDAIRIGANASANELDDYEEGSYNVQFSVGGNTYDSTNWVSGGGTVWTDNSQYVKVGRKVTLFFDLQYKGIPSSISTSTAQLYLTNLPFTMAHGGGGIIAFNWYNRNNSTANPQNFGGSTRLTPRTTNQATLINLTYHEFNSNFSDWTTESMKTNYLPTTPPGSNIYVFGQFTYFTDN